MTRGLILLTVLLFIGMIATLVLGFSTSATGWLILGLFVCGPGFVFCLGLTIGRASNEYAFVRRQDSGIVSRTANSRQRARHEVYERESLS